MEHGDYQRFLYSLEQDEVLSWRITLTAMLLPRMRLRSLARRMEQFGGRLASIDPPEDAVDEHVALIGSFRELATDVRRIAVDRRLRRSDPFRRLADLPSVDAATRAGDQLRERGFVVPTGPSR